jgi:FtsP/CotA-like multicopper oxidase with cupredoxin domain
MSNQQRIALIVAALVVAVVAFLLVSPGNDDEPERSAVSTQTQDEPQTETGDDSAEPQPTTEDEPAPPPEPQITRINIRGGTVVGGAKTIDVVKGDTVRIVVNADAPDDIHLHGYDIERTAARGQPARFRFKANAEGEFEIESHVAEDAGLDPLVARLVVSPS